jgi:rubredoxin
MSSVEHVCVVCGHIHDEEVEGDWDSLSEDFTCPECGCGKDEYETV